VANGAAWAVLDLNPAVWDATAATGWRLLVPELDRGYTPVFVESAEVVSIVSVAGVSKSSVLERLKTNEFQMQE
jgi:hypothetical protein